MGLSKNPCLVYFATQAGATPQTFDGGRCEREVALPVRALLAEEGLVEAVLVVVICDPELAVSEEALPDIRPDDGGPTELHYHTPTSLFLLEYLRRERSERRLEYLNIHLRTIHASPLNYAVNTARDSRGIDSVIVCPEGAPFPTVEDVRSIRENLEKGTTVTLLPSAVEA